MLVRRDVISSQDADAVARMRKAGAIPVAVTNLSELCMWYEASNYIYGRTNNPYHHGRTAGGSSGHSSACYTRLFYGSSPTLEQEEFVWTPSPYHPLLLLVTSHTRTVAVFKASCPLSFFIFLFWNRTLWMVDVGRPGEVPFLSANQQAVLDVAGQVRCQSASCVGAQSTDSNLEKQDRPRLSCSASWLMEWLTHCSTVH